MATVTVGIFLLFLVISIPVLHFWPELPSQIGRTVVDFVAANERAAHQARVTHVMLKARSADREAYRKIESAQRKHSGAQ